MNNNFTYKEAMDVRKTKQDKGRVTEVGRDKEDFQRFSVCSGSLPLSSAAAVLSGVCPPHVFLF